MSYLGEKYPAQFIRAAAILGMPVMPQRMPAELCAAMCEAAGIGNTSLRIMIRFFVSHFGRNILAPEKEPNRFHHNAIPPIVGSIGEGSEKQIRYWYKELDTVLKCKVELEMNNSPDLLNKGNRIDVVLGGDKGGGSFKVPMKIIFRHGKRSLQEVVYEVGEIECQNDTAEVLKRTIGTKKIDKALKKTVQYTSDDTGKIIRDGQFHFYEKDKTVAVFLNNDQLVCEGWTLKKTVDLNRLLIAGDSAFYCMALGMQGASSSSCVWCKQKKSKWNHFGHGTGEPRTLEWILAIVDEHVTKKNLLRSKKSHSGVIMMPVLTCIMVIRFVIPVLHLKLGWGNTLLWDFTEFAVNLLESRPDIQKAYNCQVELTDIWIKKKDELEIWLANDGPKLADLYLQRSDIKALAGDATENEMLTQEEVESLEVSWKMVRDEIRMHIRA